LLTGEQAEIVGRQIQAGQEFRREVDAYWKLCEQWANEELQQTRLASAEAAKKRGSRQASRRRWPRKSRP
jgi:hypothetical protein